MHNSSKSGVTTCCGCDLELPGVDGPVHRYMASSPACWAAYGQVLAREYADRHLDSIHRLSVDSYAVQHPGIRSSQSMQSVAVHLCRLCLVLENGLLPSKANDAMLELKRVEHRFRWLEPPKDRGEITVLHVLAAEGPEAHAAPVRRWAQAAWFAWSKDHETIRSWLPVAVQLSAKK